MSEPRRLDTMDVVAISYEAGDIEDGDLTTAHGLLLPFLSVQDATLQKFPVTTYKIPSGVPNLGFLQYEFKQVESRKEKKNVNVCVFYVIPSELIKR